MSTVGQKSSKWRFSVESTKVREFARAVRDDQSSKEQIPVPPTFPTFGENFRASENVGLNLDLDLRRVLHGEQEYEYLRPLRIGDRLVCQSQVVEDYAKKGRRGGTMRFIIIETEMRDEKSNEPVVRARSTVIETAAREEDVS